MIRPFIVGLLGVLAIAGSVVMSQAGPTGGGEQVRAETHLHLMQNEGQSLEGMAAPLNARVWYFTARLKQVEHLKALATARASSSSHSGVRTSSGGGSFPGDCIANHESAHAGLYTAYNPHPANNGNASGKYQVTSGTWNGYGGYSEARFAPPAVQEAQAHELWSRNPHAWNGTGCAGTG